MSDCGLCQALALVDPYDDCCQACHDGRHPMSTHRMADGAELTACCGTRAVLERRANEPAFRALWARTVACIDCGDREASPGRARQEGWRERVAAIPVWLCARCAQARTVQASQP